jgi:hypothetical protein
VGVVIVPTYPARPGSTTGQLDGAPVGPAHADGEIPGELGLVVGGVRDDELRLRMLMVVPADARGRCGGGIDLARGQRRHHLVLKAERDGLQPLSAQEPLSQGAELDTDPGLRPEVLEPLDRVPARPQRQGDAAALVRRRPSEIPLLQRVLLDDRVHDDVAIDGAVLKTHRHPFDLEADAEPLRELIGEVDLHAMNRPAPARERQRVRVRAERDRAAALYVLERPRRDARERPKRQRQQQDRQQGTNPAPHGAAAPSGFRFRM